MIIDIVSILKGERIAGDDMAAQMIERVDAHIRDLELFKAWIKDSAAARAAAICAILGEDNTATDTQADLPTVARDAPAISTADLER